jgi:hypothetical protein
MDCMPFVGTAQKVYEREAGECHVELDLFALRSWVKTEPLRQLPPIYLLSDQEQDALERVVGSLACRPSDQGVKRTDLGELDRLRYQLRGASCHY